ncbi:MAG TPA: GNAT family N-acetyltransferase [Pseudonocardiaceae bacterium]|jgi:ribosomal protein S18 acetylase RimI-like enzyme|nr:GNAT family N-acetyltransferase [Pseudonocardiaceae bacterium]
MALARSVLTPRSFDVQDTAAVLGLVNADRIPGQPLCTDAMLSEAVTGRSPVDSAWWAELDRLVVDVLCDSRGVVRGAVSYARRARDGAGLILWLHGREEPAVIEALLGHATGRLGRASSVAAFEFASALTVGLEGLPVRHRPVTRDALRARRFAEADLWRYMRRDLPAADLPRCHDADVLPDPEHPGWRVEVRGSDGVRVGDAQVSVAAPGLGVLWWIGVAASHRGQGLGWSLLGSALDVLHQHGAREVILFVDDDASADDPERGRGAANALYDRAGFAEIDRLCSYRRMG